MACRNEELAGAAKQAEERITKLAADLGAKEQERLVLAGRVREAGAANAGLQKGLAAKEQEVCRLGKPLLQASAAVMAAVLSSCLLTSSFPGSACHLAGGRAAARPPRRRRGAAQAEAAAGRSRCGT